MANNQECTAGGIIWWPREGGADAARPWRECQCSKRRRLATRTTTPPGLRTRPTLRADSQQYPEKIVEARAESADKVFILVAYLYWPHEIPTQQKKDHKFYGKDHAQAELIMSNHLQVIDATSITSKADISYWDEWNDDHLDQAPERFWRQRFDKSNFNKKHDSPTALTELRKFCTCQRPYNPDHPMYHHTTGCKNWNHEECLIEEIGPRVWESYSAGNMEQ
ncbi:hypothetical protein H2198_009333 [Neophaeococcomyces mojaviensis]|uniref:Uncharacterized protein n=1 Tax=Neophaeococcomyces mojaviensis TaxID=3383035 RepID=A0ACC2ZUZ6_9EURO|nr:hypothetical protein H2198_009333 [Knufia sp. JES_112]